MRTILSHTEVFATADTLEQLSKDVSRFLALSPFSPRLDDMRDLADAISDNLDIADSLETDVEERAFLIRAAVELNNQFSYDVAGASMYINDDLEIVMEVREAVYLNVMDTIREESTAVVGAFVAVAVMARSFFATAGSAFMRLKRSLA